MHDTIDIIRSVFHLLIILFVLFADSPGEVFVHRNIGNLVPGNDLNALSVLEYAVGHLNINDIIVTGHYDCGAVRAASMRQDLGTLENWLRQIRDVYRLHKDYLDLLKVRTSLL